MVKGSVVGVIIKVTDLVNQGICSLEKYNEVAIGGLVGIFNCGETFK